MTEKLDKLKTYHEFYQDVHSYNARMLALVEHGLSRQLGTANPKPTSPLTGTFWCKMPTKKSVEPNVQFPARPEGWSIQSFLDMLAYRLQELDYPLLEVVYETGKSIRLVFGLAPETSCSCCE